MHFSQRYFNVNVYVYVYAYNYMRECVWFLHVQVCVISYIQNFTNLYSSLYTTLLPSHPLKFSPPPPPLFPYLACLVELELRREPPPLIPPFLALLARVLQSHRSRERRQKTRRRRTDAQHRDGSRVIHRPRACASFSVSREVPHPSEISALVFTMPTLPRQ